jgi:hypothetical protein
LYQKKTTFSRTRRWEEEVRRKDMWGRRVAEGGRKKKEF